MAVNDQFLIPGLFPFSRLCGNPANTGQLHPTDSAGSGNSFLGNTHANIMPLPPTKPKELHFNRSGGPNDDLQRSRQTGFSLSRSISEPCLSSSKKGRRAETSNQSEEAESVCRVPAFQVGRHSSLGIPGKEGRFHGETGPQRCLFWAAYSKIASQILRFVWRGKTFEFQALPFG